MRGRPGWSQAIPDTEVGGIPLVVIDIPTIVILHDNEPWSSKSNNSGHYKRRSKSYWPFWSRVSRSNSARTITGLAKNTAQYASVRARVESPSRVFARPWPVVKLFRDYMERNLRPDPVPDAIWALPASASGKGSPTCIFPNPNRGTSQTSSDHDADSKAHGIYVHRADAMQAGCGAAGGRKVDV
jgi:hypothetical protein